MSQGAVIVQHEHGGHRLIFLRHLLRSPLIGARPLLVLTREAVGSWEYQEHLEPVLRESDAELRLVEQGATCEATARVALAVAAAGGRRLIVPDADLLLRTLLRADRSTRARVELRYLVTRTPMESARDRAVTASKYGLAALLGLRWKRSRGFFLTDAFGVVRRPALTALLSPLPDPSPALHFTDRETARRRLGLPAGEFICGILGTVTEGKNPDVAVAALVLLPDGYRLLLAGQLSPGVRGLVAALDPADRARVLVLDRQLSDEELGSAVSACDAVLILNDLDGPSGMLLNAAEAGVPVVVGESPWLRRVVHLERLGLSAQHRPDSVADALGRLRGEPLAVKAHATVGEEEFARRLLGR